MQPKCPKCESSEYVHLLATITKPATVVGAAGGMAMGAAGGSAGGAAVASGIAEAVDMDSVGKLGAMVVGALTGAVVGVLAGHKLGQSIDKAFGRYKCGKCGTEFEAESSV